MEESIRSSLSKILLNRRCNILLFGPLNVGKSSLINTLFTDEAKIAVSRVVKTRQFDEEKPCTISFNRYDVSEYVRVFDTWGWIPNFNNDYQKNEFEFMLDGSVKEGSSVEGSVLGKSVRTRIIDIVIFVLDPENVKNEKVMKAMAPYVEIAKKKDKCSFFVVTKVDEVIKHDVKLERDVEHALNLCNIGKEFTELSKTIIKNFRDSKVFPMINYTHEVRKSNLIMKLKEPLILEIEKSLNPSTVDEPVLRLKDSQLIEEENEDKSPPFTNNPFSNIERPTKTLRKQNEVKGIREDSEESERDEEEDEGEDDDGEEFNNPQQRANGYLRSSTEVNDALRSLSRKYFEDGFLDFNDKILTGSNPVFFDGGNGEILPDLDQRIEGDYGLQYKKDRTREIILVDLERDQTLINFLKSAKRNFGSQISELTKSMKKPQNPRKDNINNINSPEEKKKEENEEIKNEKKGTKLKDNKYNKEKKEPKDEILEEFKKKIEGVILLVVTVLESGGVSLMKSSGGGVERGGDKVTNNCSDDEKMPIIDPNFQESLLRKRMKKKGSNVFLISELMFWKEFVGTCRHRSILMKVVCDHLGIECRLIRGWSFDKTYGGAEKHAWNVIRVGKEIFLADLTTEDPEDLTPKGPKMRLSSEVNYESYVRINGNKIGGIGAESMTNGLCNPLPLRFMYQTCENVKVFREYGGFSRINEIGDSKVVVKEINLTRMTFQHRRDYLEYAKREATYMSTMNHKNVMRLIDSFKFRKNGDDFYCLLMEKKTYNGKDIISLLKSTKIENEIKRDRVLVETLIFFREIAEGVTYLHSQGFTHYDLKLMNILAEFDKSRFQLTEVKITDFGGMKNVDTLRNCTAILSTPAFTAPEILEFINYSYSKDLELKDPGKCDVFSFGKMLMEAKFIFEREPRINSLILNCIERKPEDRPSMELVSRMLRGIIVLISKNKRNARMNFNNHLNYSYTSKKKEEEEKEKEKEDEENIIKNRIKKYVFHLDMESVTMFNPIEHFKKKHFLDFHHNIYRDPFILTGIKKYSSSSLLLEQNNPVFDTSSVSIKLNLGNDRNLQTFMTKLKNLVRQLPPWSSILNDLQMKRKDNIELFRSISPPRQTAEHRHQKKSFYSNGSSINNNNNNNSNSVFYYNSIPHQNQIDVETYLSKIAECVANFFGEEKMNINEPRRLSEELRRREKRGDEEIRRVVKERKSDVIPIGDLKRAYVRPRALLFKYACDYLGIRCRYLSGWNALGSIISTATTTTTTTKKLDEKEEDNNNNINNIKIKKKVPLNIVKVFHRFYMIDLMNTFKVTREFREEDYISSGGSKEHTLERTRLMKRIHDVFVMKKKPGLKEFVKGGSFSEVWRIKKEDVKTSKDIAVKSINEVDIYKQMNISYHRYIRKEVNFMTFTNHRNIIHALGTFKYHNKYKHPCISIVMNYYPLNGRHLYYTLKKEVKDIKRRTSEVLIYLLEIAHGLQYLHSLDIIHFDLKPENILIRWDKESQEIKELVITDFAGSKDRFQNMERTIPFITPKYASREVIELKEILLRNKKSRISDQTIRRSNNNSPLFVSHHHQHFNNSPTSSPVDHHYNNNNNNNSFIPPELSNSNNGGTSSSNFIDRRRRKLPKITESSDVYSFGELMKELLEEEGLLRGYQYENLVKKCRSERQEKRPTLVQIISTLRTGLFGLQEGITTLF